MCLNTVVRHFLHFKYFEVVVFFGALPVLLDVGGSHLPPSCFWQCMYLLLHTVKGTPFETPDQGKARLLTHWEQMDYGVQFTASRKFLTITPIVL